MGTIISRDNDEEGVDLQDIDISILLSELENRLPQISESDVEFLKEHFDWVDEDEDDQALIEQAAEILEHFKVESILDTSKLEYLAKVFGKYTLEQLETLLPE